MDKAKIINSARNIFGSVSEVSTDLFKGVLNIKDRTAGIYYIDVSGKPVDNIEQYQEDMFAKDYYNNPGSIQWNYYLLLMRDQVNEEERKSLEHNDKYARKYLFTEADFDDFFHLEKSTQPIGINIIQQWKQELDSVDLQEVYSNESITGVASRFEHNQTKKIAAGNTKRAKKGDDDRIRKINKLKLNKTYRTFPTNRDYTFGSVNLFKGTNGVGKTSLFEAIEFIICGRSFRNKDQKYDDDAIEAVFNGGYNNIQKLDCSIKANEKYRLRDLAWYSNHSVKDHELDASFNRYNFFNADAAYRFSNGGDDKEVHDALFNIVFGPEYDLITTRIEKVYDKLKPLYNRFRSDQDAAKKAKDLAEKEIKKLQKADALGSIKKTITKSQETLGYINPYSDVEKELLSIEEVFLRIETLVDNILKNESVDTLAELKQKRTEWRTRNELFESFRKQFKEFEDRKSANAKDDLMSQNRKTLLSNALKYLADEKFFKLAGITSKIGNLTSEISGIENLQQRVKDINLDDFVKEVKTIGELIKENDTKQVSLSLKIDGEEKKRKDFLEKFDRTEQVIREIKSLGSEYLSINSSAMNCPMCQSDFSRSELEQRILQLAGDNEVANPGLSLAALDEPIGKMKTEAGQLFGRDLLLRNLQSVLAMFDPSSGPRKPVEESITQIKIRLSALPAVNQQLSEMKGIVQYAQAAGLTETELNYIKQQIEKEGLKIEFKFENKVAFEELLRANETKLNEISISAEQVAQDKSLADIQFKSKMGLPLEESFTLNGIRPQIDKEGQKVQLIEDCFIKLAELIRFTDQSSVQSISVNGEIMKKNLALYKAEVREQQLLKTQEKYKTDAEAIIQSTSEALKRFEPACEKLKCLMDDKGNSQLDSFFENNLIEILDVFKNIHMPKEFTNIKLEGEVIYLTTETGENRKVTEISTGQRSALVLSIFITLNRKLKGGPDIILFDDPVSFVDDLNALSFLDYLRFFVLKEGKQIFFATANSRLANLFERKFQFLGEEDFKVWPLTR